MYLRPSHVLALTAALVFPAATALPAQAGNNLAITATPDHAHLTESFTVDGTGGCATTAYTVTFTYTNHDGDPATATANGTTNGSGAFSQSITIPEAATAGEPASVQATVACQSPLTSNTLPITIDTFTGVLSLDKTTGEPGDTVTVSGTNCYGGDVVVLFTDGDAADEVAVTLDSQAHTFTGTYTLPDAPGGDYAFAAECPGSQFEDQGFALVNDQPAPSPTTAPPAPPATVVDDNADFTG
jgi:hypothetical protein